MDDNEQDDELQDIVYVFRGDFNSSLVNPSISILRSDDGRVKDLGSEYEQIGKSRLGNDREIVFWIKRNKEMENEFKG